jgi:hypothetical protein
MIGRQTIDSDRMAIGSKIFSDDQLQRWKIDLIRRNLRQRLGGYGVVAKHINPGQLLYRGVLWTDRPTLVEHLWHPPVGKAQLSRANREGQPLFYACKAAAGVCFELRAKVGDRIAISEWDLIEPLWMHNLGYHDAALNRMGVSARGPRMALTHPLRNETKQNEKLRRALSLAFTEEIAPDTAYRYKQTIAICELMFHDASPFPIYADGPKYEEASGAVYPAIQMLGAADNVVIFPKFVESSLRLRSVRYVMVDAIDYTQPSYSLRTLAISTKSEDGKIMWDSDPSPDTARSSAAREGRFWVIRDALGKAYDVHPAD